MAESSRRAARCRRGPRRRRQAGHRVLRPASRPRRARPAGVVRHLRAPRLGADRDVQRGPHRRHHPGDLRVPGGRRASTGRCTWARTPTRFPSLRRSARWRCWPPTASGCCSTRAAGTRRPRRCPARSWRTTRRDAGPRGGRDRGHAVAQPAVGRRLQVQPARRRPGRHRHHPADPGPGQRRCWPTGWPACAASRTPRAAAADTTGRYDFLDAYVSALAQVVDLDAIRAAGVRIGADPLGGASVGYWGEIAERYGLDLTVVNPLVDADVPVHDPGLGRQDPDGLLVAVRHGQPDRPPARVHGRDRQRHRRRPARHRHPRRRAAQPEPLPGRRHRLPVPPPRRLAARRPRSARRWSARR